MKQTINKTCALLQVTVNKLNEEIYNIALKQDYEKYIGIIFEEIYKEIKENYMKKSVKHLDRHKVANIIIISILKSDTITYQGKIEQDKDFFGQYLIAVSVGITFMQNQLNALLLEKHETPIKKIYFPETLSCDTPYFEVLCRNLYYSNKNNNWGFNPLELAEKLFLLEYMTLKENGIDPHILKSDSSCEI